MLKNVILLIGTSNIGGGEKVAINLYNYLKNQKSINPFLLTAFSSEKKNYKIKSICLVPEKFDSKILRYIILIIRLRRFINKINGKKVLITFMPHMNYVGSICKNKNLNLFITEHNIKSPINAKIINFVHSILSYILYRRAKKIISVSSGVASYVKNKTNIKSIIINNYIKPSKQIKNFKNSKNIILLGRLHYQKGFDDGLKIFKKSKLFEIGYTLKIYGDGPEARNLIKLSKRLRIYEYVNFYEASENIDLVFSDARLFLYTSRWEGFGLTFAESLVRGIPVVGFSCHSGPDEIQNDLKIRGIIEYRDIEKASDLLINEIKNCSKNKDLSHYRNYIINNYSDKNTHEKYLRIINEKN